MEKIRKIVIEQLTKTLQFIREEFKLELKAPEISSKDDIIRNFEKGRAFGYNELHDKIKNLNHYNLSDYFPLDENLEKWSFEYNTPYGTTLMVEIKHKVTEHRSLWLLIFSKGDASGAPPVIESSSGPINGYDKFVAYANEHMSKLIDPRRG